MTNFAEMKAYHQKRREEAGWTAPPSPTPKKKTVDADSAPAAGTLAAVDFDRQSRIVNLFGSRAAVLPKIDAKSQAFLNDMAEKYEKWGDKMFMSESQIKYLLGLASRLK